MEIKFIKRKDLTPEDDPVSSISGFFPVIQIHLEDPEFNPIHAEKDGNWIDLMAAEDVTLKRGESKLIRLGVSMKVPKGFEAHLLPRSSTFKRYHIIQTNGMGIIDDTYSGTNDVWMMSVYATEDTAIARGARIAQFRLEPTMETMFFGGNSAILYKSCINPKLVFIIEDSLDDVDRGGFGSTGI